MRIDIFVIKSIRVLNMNRIIFVFKVLKMYIHIYSMALTLDNGLHPNPTVRAEKKITNPII